MSATLDDLADNVFSCKETPLWFPNEMTRADAEGLPSCTSCILRFVSPAPGPGILRNTDTGLSIDESPLVTFYYNGMEHTLLDTQLMIPGAHRYPGASAVPPAELFLYFRNTKNGKAVCICIPISDKEGTGSVPGKEYFASLSESPTTAKRPPLSTILPKERWVQYKGPDIRGRTKETPTPRNLCEPVGLYVTYMLSLGSIQIPTALLVSLQTRKKSVPNPKDAPEPNLATGISASRAKTLLTLLPIFQIKGAEPVVPPTGESVALKQMKCHRLDTQRDIKGDRVYIGGKGIPKRTTLQDELDKAARGELDAEQDPRVKAGTVFAAIGIAIGIAIAVVILAVIAYYVMGFTFPNYLDIVNNLYSDSVKPVSSLSSPFTSMFSKVQTMACGAEKIASQSK